jgi:hypothetical protein
MPATRLCFGPLSLRSLPLLLAALLFFSGCRKPEIKSYTAPKDVEETRPVSSELAEGLPKISWTTPAGWTEHGPDNMNAARFSLPGEANVMITPLALMAGNEDSLVNMWRQMLALPLLGEKEAAEALTEVPIGGASGKLFEVTGAREESGEMKIVTAFLHRDSRSWFFKLQGAPAAVDAQRAAFLEFLKTVKFDAAAAPSPALPPSSAPPAATSSEVPGAPPADWAAQSPGPMQAAKFSVPDKDGAKAEVTVSIFPSDTGGNVANARRWRGQLGLTDTDDAAIAALIKPLPGGPENAVMVELVNEARALTGAIVPRGGKWFFYKLTGDAPAVAAARETFLNYCKAGS